MIGAALFRSTGRRGVGGRRAAPFGSRALRQEPAAARHPGTEPAARAAVEAVGTPAPDTNCTERVTVARRSAAAGVVAAAAGERGPLGNVEQRRDSDAPQCGEQGLLREGEAQPQLAVLDDRCQ